MSGAIDTFKQYIESTVAVNLLKSLLADGKYKDAVAKTEDFIAKTFPDKQKEIKQAVSDLVIAYANELKGGAS